VGVGDALTQGGDPAGVRTTKLDPLLLEIFFVEGVQDDLAPFRTLHHCRTLFLERKNKQTTYIYLVRA